MDMYDDDEEATVWGSRVAFGAMAITALIMAGLVGAFASSMAKYAGLL